MNPAVDISRAGPPVAARPIDLPQTLLAEGLEHLDAGITIFDADLRLVFCNRKFLELRALPHRLGRTGTEFADIVRYNAEHGVYGAGDVDDHVYRHVELARRFEPHRFERELANGQTLEIHGSPLPGGGFITIYTDVTPRKQAEQTIQRLALVDGLTGLANRTSFHQSLLDALPLAERLGHSVALMMLDLDRFKHVNDGYGHPVGDALLQEVARRLLQLFRRSDIVARLGGDEFAILLTSLSDGRNVRRVAQRVVDTLARPMRLDGNDIRTGTSIGISFFPTDDTDPEELIRKADLALYKAKAGGRGSYHIYDRSLHEAVERQRTMEEDLRAALRRDELMLYYQPQVSLRDGKLIGVEALIRWQHPERGLLLPSEFIEAAESVGLMNEVGELVMRTACAQANEWRRAGWPDLRMAVNISTRQLQTDGFVGLVQRVLTQTGLPAAWLELEITEDSIVTDADKVGTKLLTLKDGGVSLAIDDFGTGYSSLGYLKKFPVNRLKIDRSFIKDLPVSADDTAITRAIVRLGHSLGLDVLAEGVETRDQLDHLRAERCDSIQGFYCSEPLPPDEMAARIDTRSLGGCGLIDSERPY